MTILTNDDGSNWLSDGSAIAVGTGAGQVDIETDVDGNAVYATSPGTTPDGATVAIETPEGLQSRLEFDTLAQAQDGLDNADNEYWQEFELRFVDDGSFVSVPSPPILRIFDYAITGYRSSLIARADKRISGDPANQRDGVYLYADVNTGTTTDENNITSEARILAFGAYMGFAILVSGTNPGRLAMFANGVLIAEAWGGDFTAPRGAESTHDYRVDTNLSSANMAGITAQIAPPLKSYGRTRPERLTPLWEREPTANNSVYKHLIHHPRVATAKEDGRHWYYTDSGGASTVIMSYNYMTQDCRALIDFSAAGSMTMTSCDDVGALPYRTLDGWCTVVVRDYLHVSGATLTLDLRNTADDASLCQLSVDASGNLSLGDPVAGLTDTGIDLTATRWTLAIHLHKDGGCRVTVVDNSNDGSSQYIWSGIGSDWNAATSVGPLILVTAHDSGMTELSMVSVCETWEGPFYDSMTHRVMSAERQMTVNTVVGTFLYGEWVNHSNGSSGFYKGTIETTLYLGIRTGTLAGSGTLTGAQSGATCNVSAIATGPTPDVPESNNLSTPIYAMAGFSIPGAQFPMKDEWAAIGQGRRECVTIFGRTGASQALDGSKTYSTGLYGIIRTTGQTGIADTRGARFWFPDGLVSVNDTTGYATVTDSASAISESTDNLADADTVLQAIMDAGCEAWVWDHSYRTNLSSWDTFTQQYVDLMNDGFVNLIDKYQDNGRIQWSPTNTDFSDDNVHPSNDDSLEKSQKAVGGIVILGLVGLRNRMTRGSTQRPNRLF